MAIFNAYSPKNVRAFNYFLVGYNCPRVFFFFLLFSFFIQTYTMETIYENFNRYPWDTDNVFQAGLDTILESLPRDNEDELVEQARLLKAKHFYFTR